MLQTAGAAATAASRAVSGPGPHLEPSPRVLKLWRGAQAVCFDIDCEHAGTLVPARCIQSCSSKRSSLQPLSLPGAGRLLPISWCFLVPPSLADVFVGRSAPLYINTHQALHLPKHHYPYPCVLMSTQHCCCPAVAGTVAINDQLDLLAEFMGVGQKVAAITNSVGASCLLQQLAASGRRACGGALWGSRQFSGPSEGVSDRGGQHYCLLLVLQGQHR